MAEALIGKFVGVVLAGGKSQRMGYDKATLILAGKRWVDQMISLLHEAGADPIWVSGTLAGYNSIPDEIADCGPLAGLSAVINLLHHEGPNKTKIAVVPVDMLAIAPARIRELVDALGTTPNEYHAAQFAGYPLPLVFWNSPEFANALRETLASTRSIRQLLSKISHHTVPCLPEWSAQFINLNTPAELNNLVISRISS